MTKNISFASFPMEPDSISLRLISSLFARKEGCGYLTKRRSVLATLPGSTSSFTDDLLHTLPEYKHVFGRKFCFTFRKLRLIFFTKKGEVNATTRVVLHVIAIENTSIS